MTMIPTRHATIPVAECPDPGAATYAQVRRNADTISLDGAFVDPEAPDGCFGLVVRNSGGVQAYWFRGPFGDPRARVVARTQGINLAPTHYVGGSLSGGQPTSLHQDP